MSKNQKKYIGIFIAIVFLIVVAFATTWELSSQVVAPIIETSDNTELTIPALETNTNLKAQTPNPHTPPETVNVKEDENTESATVIAGDVTARLSFASDTVFYDALVEAKKEDQIQFGGKNYSGLGFFVTEIGTLRAGGGKYLLYYINGQEASVGVSAYTLQDGDIIEWKLE